MKGGAGGEPPCSPTKPPAGQFIHSCFFAIKNPNLYTQASAMPILACALQASK